MPRQYDFIRRFENKAETGHDVLFACPTSGYARYWIESTYDYLFHHSHENHKPTISRARMTIGYRGSTMYFIVFEKNSDDEKIRGHNFKDWFDPGTLPLLCRETIRTRIR